MIVITTVASPSSLGKLLIPGTASLASFFTSDARVACAVVLLSAAAKVDSGEAVVELTSSPEQPFNIKAPTTKSATKKFLGAFNSIFSTKLDPCILASIVI